jgi:hypothetical protein
MIAYKQVLWIDKHHCQVAIGLDGITSEFKTLFARDKNGSMDTTGKGQYCEGKKKVKMKYTNGARFSCFGCCYTSKNRKGSFHNNFVYPSQTILCSSANYGKVKHNEMERVTSPKGGLIGSKTAKKGVYGWTTLSQ